MSKTRDVGFLSNIMQYTSAGDISLVSGSTTRMFISASGNVGIGTNTPSAKLNLIGGELKWGYTSDLGALSYTDNKPMLASVGATDFLFYTNATERMRITSGGNVGIGTSSPASFTNFTTLTINNAVQGGVLQLQSNGTNALQISCNATEAYIYEYRNNPLIFATNSTERMRITSGGNVLIGTSTDNSTGPLQSGGAIGLNGSINNLSTGTGTYTRTVWYVDTSNQILFENGRTTDSLSGTGRTVYFTWRGGPSVGGGVQLQHGTNAWSAYTSDARLKTKVADIENGIDTIMKLNPIKFKWSRELENSRTVTGFTAQNVEEAIPDAVFNSWQDPELGDVKSYYQDYLVPYLVKAIQELKAEIEILKNK